ncbi:hypothetical protein BKP37_04555 [Anaerobacillus alkalilacustris]|uniref:Histidine kinase domain-containing protein n=1 Tax=Anaerobacillus alkalilacustris TaxID=393763 RepID=A0A1S2LYM1_9BACI|nr:HAMP domain-containing sensor histidine kinase [Anaerobacillus alkalilacustris]OIJ16807.1 hypothetical protein BKP37_04555 [Anaerobacillus alkalilacustris]
MKCVKITIDKRGNEPFLVFGNKEKIQQVFVNIIKNAIEASCESGEIQITLFQEIDYHVITICDQGKGLTETEIERLGTPFYSTKEIGTGVGSFNYI